MMLVVTAAQVCGQLAQARHVAVMGIAVEIEAVTLAAIAGLTFYALPLRYNTIRDAILTCAQKLTYM